MQKVRGRLLLCTVSFSLSSTFIQAFALHRIISQTRRTSLPFSMTKHQHHHLAQSAGSLVSPLEKHGKSLPKVSMSTFLLTTAFIPVWAVTVLPMSFLYLAGSAALKPIVSVFRSSSRKLSSASTQTKQLDSGYVVFPAVIIPRADRQYDIVVLGATGFTGYLAARHLAKTYGVNKTVKWAIAGRSEVKLEKVKQDLAKELNMEEISALDTILVDTAMASTLPKLVSQTRVVATTAGPYALYGSQVVEFCAKFGTHYVDITGEVDWVKAMISQWQETAHKTGSRLIPFCGHGKSPLLHIFFNLLFKTLLN